MSKLVTALLIAALALLGVAPTNAATIATRGAASAKAYGFGGGLPKDPFFASVTLLTHADSFVDVKGHALISNGGAAISTTTKKFGTGSFSFNGTTASVGVTASSDWTFGTAPFTVEGWVNFNSVTGAQTLLTNVSQVALNDSFRIGLNSGVLTFWTWNIGVITGTIAPSAGAWVYVAATYDGTTYRLFVNGVLDGSSTAAQNLSGVYDLYFGYSGVAANPFYLNGFLDEWRITKGVCRYTATFTPPPRPFPNR